MKTITGHFPAKDHSETIKTAVKMLFFLAVIAAILSGCGNDKNVYIPVPVEQTVEQETSQETPVETPVNYDAGGTHFKVFILWYGLTDSKLDTCTSCHDPHAERLLNSYGLDISQALQSGLAYADALIAVEGMDSDGDGFTNIEEIGALTFPGDATDHP